MTTGSADSARPVVRGAGGRNSSRPRRRASRLLQDATRYLVGGVNSPVRAFRATGQAPLCLVRGAGARVTDETGRQFIDLIMGWGALILGHAHPTVLQAVRRQIAKGTVLGLTHPAEVELAAAIVEAFPSIEQVRFMTSGTEACMTAIRLARAATGRSTLLMFEGCYHGHNDGLLVKRGAEARSTRGMPRSAGVSERVAQETVVVPYHDLEALEETIARYGETLACAMVEPVAANMGVVVPQREFLERLRTLTAQHGILLIFDEVVTGFRASYGGVQTLVRITPDVTVLGKIIGGGFPIGAVGGPRALMQHLAPEGPVYHAGTFAGHPVSMAAGLATLHELKHNPPYAHLESLGTQVEHGLLKAASRSRTAIRVNRFGSMLTVFFSGSPVTRLDEARRADGVRFAAFANALRQQGILIPPSPLEAMFLSTRHTAGMMSDLVRVAADVWAA